MLTTVWRQFFVVWSERNNTIHGNTHATRQAALRQTITCEIHQWFYRRDQLLQSNRMDILEAKFRPAIETADAQVDKDPPHVSLNWLRMYSPILLGGHQACHRNSNLGCSTYEQILSNHLSGWY
jgi:hypothetical protein